MPPPMYDGGFDHSSFTGPNISVLENGGDENVICGKGNSKKVEDRGEEGIKTSTECHENSNSCNIEKDDVAENIVSSRTEK